MQAPRFPTLDGKENDLQTLFLGATNVSFIAQKIGKNVSVKPTMEKFAKDLEIERGGAESVDNNISESLQFLNQLFLDKYGSFKDETHERNYGSKLGKYPKVNLSDRFNYNDIYAFREHDAQMDQKTYRDDSRFRYQNKIKPWQQAGHRNRHITENTGLRLGTFQEKENINRGYAMETILASNRYNTKPNYKFDTLLGETDRLQ